MNFENQEYVKNLDSDIQVVIVSEEEKRYREIFKGQNFKFKKYPLYEGYRDENTLVLTDRELKGIRVKREKKDKGLQTNILPEHRGKSP